MPESNVTLPRKCLHCNADLTLPLVCTGCHTLIPPPREADYFDLLGVERTYRLDEAKLDSAFRVLSRSIHPDRFAGEAEPMRDLAIRLSAEVNRAYDVLKDPVRRAAYLLERCGGPTASDVREVPGNLLAEVMMIREEMEEAKESGDRETLARLRETITRKRDETLAEIERRAEALEGASDDDKIELRKLLNAMKYFDNLLEDLTEDPWANAQTPNP